MKDLKSSLLTLICLLMLFSCNSKKKKLVAFDYESQLAKFNCFEEYNNARYYYYCKYYNIYAVVFMCDYTNIRDSIPIAFLDIKLSKSTSNIELLNDTVIRFSFNSYLNDSCICANTANRMNYSPGRITVNRKTKKIINDEGWTTIYVMENEKKHESILNNMQLKEFIDSNEKNVNSWFLNEYKVRYKR